MKDKIYKIKIFFKHYLTFYIGFQDWKEQVWESSLDEETCCSGYMCNCGGRTIRQNFRENFK